MDCALRFCGFEVDAVLDEGFVFEVDFDAEAVDVEDNLRVVVLDVVLFASDWRRGALKGKRLRFA